MDQVTKSWLMLVIILIAGLMVILLIREIALWYWRVNHIVQKLESIDNNLRVIASKLESKSQEAKETKDV
ncbi:hypothetical protein [Cohnella mopanensis]|uniref:hypothetical protein n=1 Tax=Cohnella mopanensis TaxID=2911966 RepID=UPI001EF95DA2|nr:hypothetical protein [Cohnella mopanensis]